MRDEPGVSGKKVIAVIAIGVVLVAVVTFVLYLATRQLDYDPDAEDPSEIITGPFTAEASAPELLLMGLPEGSHPMAAVAPVTRLLLAGREPALAARVGLADEATL